MMQAVVIFRTGDTQAVGEFYGGSYIEFIEMVPSSPRFEPIHYCAATKTCWFLESDKLP